LTCHEIFAVRKYQKVIQAIVSKNLLVLSWHAATIVKVQKYVIIHYNQHQRQEMLEKSLGIKQNQTPRTRPQPCCTGLFLGAQMPPTNAPITLRPSNVETTQLALTLILTPALAYPPSSIFLAPTAFSVLKHPNNPMPLAPSFSYSSIFRARQLWTISGESVMQYWKHPSLSSELMMTGVEDADGDDVVASGAEYVAIALMWPLQHASSIEELEPPTGTAQDERVVGGWGIEVNDWQDIVALLLVFSRNCFGYLIC
jgi:hypothetical protein